MAAALVNQKGILPGSWCRRHSFNYGGRTVAVICAMMKPHFSKHQSPASNSTGHTRPVTTYARPLQSGG